MFFFVKLNIFYYNRSLFQIFFFKLWLFCTYYVNCRLNIFIRDAYNYIKKIFEVNIFTTIREHLSDVVKNTTEITTK